MVDDAEVKDALLRFDAVTRNGADVYPRAGSLRDYVTKRSASDD